MRWTWCHLLLWVHTPSDPHLLLHLKCFAPLHLGLCTELAHPSLYLVGHESCHWVSLQVSSPRQAGTDHTFAKRQIASQKVKVFDLKGIERDLNRCLDSRKTSKHQRCFIFPCFTMFKQIQCIIWSNDQNTYRREW